MTDKLTVHVTLIQGSGLVAKDRNLFGKKSSSDPFVECYSVYQKADGPHGGMKTYGKKMGATEVVKKSLEPKYNHQFPTIEFAYAQNPTIQLRIFDYDKIGDNDPMGTVNIPVPTHDSIDTTQWYDIPKDSAKHASGKLQVRIQTTVHKLVAYVTASKRKTTSGGIFASNSSGGYGSGSKSKSKGSKKQPPKRFIKIDGVMKLSPEYMKWKETHG